MTDPRVDSMVEELERLARSVRSVELRQSTEERLELETRLGFGTIMRRSALDLPSATAGASEPDRTLGNVLPYYGQSNLLPDPTFERLAGRAGIGAISTTANTDGTWFYKRVQNSGSDPNLTGITLVSRDTDTNPFNSALARFAFTSIISGDTTFYLYPAADFNAEFSPVLPFLVASVRVADLGSTASVFTNVTSLTCRLQILNGAGTVIAESETLDLKNDLPYQQQRQLMAFIQDDEASFQADDWLWRVRIDLVATGSGGSINVDLGEPALHFAYSPDAAPFAPQLGRWRPTGVVYQAADGAAAEYIVVSTLGGQTVRVFSIDSTGKLQWGDGAGGAIDTELARVDTGHLAIGTTLSITGVISPSQITSNQNDYQPTSGDAAFMWRLTTDATPRTITGCVRNPHVQGALLYLVNGNSSTSITLAHDTGSVGAHRFFCPGGANYTLQAGGGVLLVYDGVSTRWRVSQ